MHSTCIHAQKYMHTNTSMLYKPLFSLPVAISSLVDDRDSPKFLQLICLVFEDHFFYFPEKAMAPHSSTLAWKSHGWRAWWAVVHGVTRSRTRLSDFTFTFFYFHHLILNIHFILRYHAHLN